MRQVEVFYDFSAPLSFVAHERVRQLWRGLPLRFAWVPCELGGPPRDGRAMTPLEERLFAEQNLPFRPAKKPPVPTLAHRAALWCEARNAASAEDFRDRVFRRLYERGLDIDHPDVLAGLVESSGLDPITFLEDLKGGAFAKEVRDNRARAEERGVRAVPTFAVGRSCIGGYEEWNVLDKALTAFAARNPGAG